MVIYITMNLPTHTASIDRYAFQVSLNTHSIVHAVGFVSQTLLTISHNHFEKNINEMEYYTT